MRRIKVTECLLWRKKMPPCCKLLASTVSVAIHSPSQCHLAQSAHRLGWFCQSHREPPDVQLDWLISHTHLFQLFTLLSISISLFLKVLFFFFSDTTSFYRFFSFPLEPFALSPAGFSSSSNFSGVRSPDVVHGSHFLNLGYGFNDQLNDDDFHIRISVQALSPELRNLISHNLLDWFPDAPFSTSN